MISYSRQHISEEDVKSVLDVLRSDFLTQGPVVPAFEEGIAEFCKAKHAVAVNSGTSALHIACLALGVGPGDWVWTSPITFVASANCARYCGAQVDFVDIDPSTYNLSVERLAEKLQRASTEGRLPKVVIPVHFAGQPCDLRGIHELSKQYRFAVIEDASHALGARYCESPVGDCRYSDIAVFSFHPVKTITTAEGGMAVTNDSGLANKMRMFRSHGITRDPESMSGTPDGPWYYEQTLLGYNYRLTDLQAALGLSQLSQIQSFIDKRTELARRYDGKLQSLPLTLPVLRPDCRSSWHLYVVRVQPDAHRRSRAKLFSALRECGVHAQVHYIPLHTQPYYRAHAQTPQKLREAERYYEEAISLPLFYDLKEGEQDQVVDCINRSLSGSG